MHVPYSTKFGGRKIRWINVKKCFGGKNSGGLVALYNRLGR